MCIRDRSFLLFVDFNLSRFFLALSWPLFQFLFFVHFHRYFCRLIKTIAWINVHVRTRPRGNVITATTLEVRGVPMTWYHEWLTLHNVPHRTETGHHCINLTASVVQTLKRPSIQSFWSELAEFFPPLWLRNENNKLPFNLNVKCYLNVNTF